MLFKNKSKRKYIGIMIVILSVSLFSTQFGPYLGYDKTPSSVSSLTRVASIVGIITGVCFIAGPLSALIAMIPLAVSGCGGNPPPPDLGEPPEPPSTSFHLP